MQDPIANILALVNQVQVQILVLAGYGQQWGQCVILLNELNPEMHFLENITVQDGKGKTGDVQQYIMLLLLSWLEHKNNNIVEKVICLSTLNKNVPKLDQWDKLFHSDLILT